MAGDYDPNWQWKVYQDPRFDLNVDWRYRKCPFCGDEHMRHSIQIIVQGLQEDYPEDACMNCWHGHNILDKVEW